MFFQNPMVWWLAPLALLPFIIHFRHFFRQRTQDLPSLFFIEKLLQKRYKHLNKRVLLETLLETLIILLALLLWSHPTRNIAPQTGEKLILLIDDSPSMRYFYLERPRAEGFALASTLLTEVAELIAQKTFSEIEARRLSTLSKGETQKITTLTDLKVFLKNIGETATYSNWNARDLRELLERLYTLEPEQTNLNYLLYSDFKDNHFPRAFNQTASRTPTGTPTKLFGDRAFYVLKERPAPYLEEITLASRHFFTHEKLTLTHTLYNIPPIQQNSTNHLPTDNLFLEVTLDNKQIYLSKIISPQATNASTEKGGPTPLVFKSDLVLNKRGIHILSVTLKQGQTLIQRENEVVFVYPKLSIRPIVKDKQVINFLEALFLFDKRAEAISLAPEGDTLFITDPETALQTLKLANIRSHKAIVLLSPRTDIRQAETILRNISTANIYLSSLEKMSAQSQFYWNERPQDTPLFDPSFSSDKSYLKLSPQSSEKIRPLFSIDSYPAMFLSRDKVFFTFLSETSLLETPHPLHLIWFYEALFALNGGKLIVPVYDKASFTLNNINANLTNLTTRLIGTAPSTATNTHTETNSTPSATLSPLANESLPSIWEDDKHVYILKNPRNEHTAQTILTSEEREAVLPYLGNVTVIETATPATHSPSISPTIAFLALSPSYFILLLTLFCCIFLIGLLLKRLRSSTQS